MNTEIKPAPPKLTRAEKQRLQLREDIIEASFKEFSARGYHQTAISHIAKRLGIGHGTFYRHFKNKRDILDHVIDSTYDRIKVAMAEENAPSATTTIEEYETQVRRIGISLAQIISETPELFRMIFFEATSIDDAMTKRVMDFMDWAAEQTGAYFKNGVKIGFLREDLDIEATAHVLVGMIFTSILSSINRNDQDLFKRINNAVIRVLFQGIAKHN